MAAKPSRHSSTHRPLLVMSHKIKTSDTCPRFLFFAVGVKFFVDLTQMSVSDVGVDLGGADMRMTEEGLHRAKVSAVTEKVGGEAVTNNMGSYLARDTGFGGVEFQKSLDRTRRDAGVFTDMSLSSVPNEEGVFHVLPSSQVVFDSGTGVFREEYHPNFISLSSNRELIPRQVYTIDREGTEL